MHHGRRTSTSSKTHARIQFQEAVDSQVNGSNKIPKVKQIYRVKESRDSYKLSLSEKSTKYREYN